MPCIGLLLHGQGTVEWVGCYWQWADSHRWQRQRGQHPMGIRQTCNSAWIPVDCLAGSLKWSGSRLHFQYIRRCGAVCPRPHAWWHYCWGLNCGGCPWHDNSIGLHPGSSCWCLPPIVPLWLQPAECPAQWYGSGALAAHHPLATAARCLCAWISARLLRGAQYSSDRWTSLSIVGQGCRASGRIRGLGWWTVCRLADVGTEWCWTFLPPFPSDGKVRRACCLARIVLRHPASYSR